MGTTVGSIIIINMYKLLVAAAVIAVASCEAEAEPGYVYGAYPALYNAYPNWPGVSGPGFSSTCHGCRPYYGKSSADAEAEADPAYLYGAYAAYPYFYRPYYASGYAGPLPGASYQSVHRLHKREAEADAEADPALFYGAYGYPYAYGYPAYGYRYGLAGVAAHPGAATSFVARSPQGLGKRSAEADPALLYGAYPYVYGFAPVSYSTHGYGPSGYTIGQGHPGAASSFQSVSRLH